MYNAVLWKIIYSGMNEVVMHKYYVGHVRLFSCSQNLPVRSQEVGGAKGKDSGQNVVGRSYKSGVAEYLEIL